MGDETVSIKEAARRVGVAPVQVRRWIALGLVRPVTRTRVVTEGIRAADLPRLATLTRERRPGRPAKGDASGEVR